MSDEKKKEEPTQSEKNLIDLLSKFQDHFIPASTIGEADEMMNTNDICDYLEDMLGDDIPRQKVFDILNKNGYTHTWFGDGFKWLLKIKQL